MFPMDKKLSRVVDDQQFLSETCATYQPIDQKGNFVS